MSTANEHSVCEQVLYRGKNKQKWEHRNITVKKNVRNGKYVVEVKQIPQRQLFWKLAKKPEIMELVPNNNAVIHLDNLNNHRNVIALIHIKNIGRNAQITAQFFASEDTQVVCNLRDFLSKCCDGISFDVAVSNQFMAILGNTQLLIFRDRICLTTNQGYEFTLLKEWPIESLTQLTATASGVSLVMTNEGREETRETLDLRTEQGNDIEVILSDEVRCLSPAILQQLSWGLNVAAGATQCDGNSNILPATNESRALKANLWPCTANNHETQGKLSSLQHSTYSSRQSASSGDVRLSPLDLQCVSGSKFDSWLSAVTHTPQHDNEVNTQKQLKMNDTAETCASDCKVKPERKHAEEEHELDPPPIPQRQLKPNSKVTTQSNLESCETSANNNNMGDFTLPRTPNFQIVKQPLHEPKRQRHNSMPNTGKRKTITELVRPICVELPLEKSENSCDGDLLDLEPSGNVCSTMDKHCTKVENEDDHKDYEHYKLADLVENEEEPARDKLHYVNLPQGSRPSCYLYMNLPDPKKAPKESVTYVNHVYMGRSMKGIYENVFSIMSGSPEEKEAVPELPPPALLPRQPPPRIPQRLSLTGRQIPPKLPVKLPETHALPCPPPRPPRKPVTYKSAAQEDIQVQIAVFASRAVVSQVWYLRIVVMKHDPDDTTFKTVKERELASKYHLMQTYPCNISSDVVISLKHQCQWFKLTSEDSQEVDYHIIKNLVHGFWFVVEYHLEHLSSEVDQFVGNVCVEPKGLPVGEKCPVNKKFNLGITEDFELKQHCRKCEKPGNEYAEEHKPCKLVISDYTLRRKVCQQLDDTIHSYCNWKDVAGQLKFSVEEIKFIENKAYRWHAFSPMEDVLTTWEKRDPECSLERLVSILIDIKRLDVVYDLEYPMDSRSS